MGGAPEPDPDRSVTGNTDRDHVPIPVAGIQNTDDEEYDEQVYRGYQPLAQAPPEQGEPALATWSNSLYSDHSDESTDEDDDHDHDNAQNMEIDEPVIAHPANVTDLPPIDTVDREIVREVWNQPRTDADIQMDATKAREVMSAMANFSLPTSSFPEWARDVSEDEWKRRLAVKINNQSQNQSNR